MAPACPWGATVTGFSMTTGEFEVDRWVERLAQQLERLSRIQDDYWEEFYRQDAQGPRGDEFRDPSDRFIRFYWRAWSGESRFDENRFRAVRAELTEIRRILSAHPAWTGLVDSSCNGRVWVQLPNAGSVMDPSKLIAGLMARGMEAGEDGFREACFELSLLLDPDGDPDRESGAGELLVGYHVVLLQGLNVGEEVRLRDRTMIVPFERLDAFFDAGMLERMIPDAARYRGAGFFAAVVKPFRWKPGFNDGDIGPIPDGARVGSFFEDAGALIELLALFHAAPVVRLASVGWRLHRTACRLLGIVDVHRSCGGSPSSYAVGWPKSPVAAKREAIDAAVRAFADVNGERFGNCAPVISRLAEALARSGQYAVDDKILDVAIALERMYELERRDGSFQLKVRAAYFLEEEPEARWQVFEDVGTLFDARSCIIHHRERPKSWEEKQEAFKKGFEQARRALARLLEEGAPDWKRLIDPVTQSGERVSGAGAGTTSPAYRNRNGQVVIRRTDLQGNDHNQRVYVLKCGNCRREYGANGSDIWQRKCPQCGGGRPGLSYS